MLNFRRSLTVVFLATGSISLLACSGGDSSSADPHTGTGAAAATALPLLERCSGTYTCKSAGSSETTSFALHPENGGCRAGSAWFEADHELTTDAGGHQKLATWSGDSRAFDVCADDGCLHCTDNAAPTTSASASAPSGSCSGSTSCSDYGPGSCGSHSGCTMHSHAVYSFGHFDHYENECQGSTPDCSSHDSAEVCEREGCTWK